ncbi:MAG: NAD(P)H-hydrate dehydratase [Pseudoramibacter sp.]
MKVVTPSEMSEMDRQTIAHGIADYELMERAGARCFEVINQEIPEHSKILVLCGSGNNGGDGQVIARLCRHHGHQAEVLFTGNPDHFTPNSRQNFNRLQGIGLPYTFYSEMNEAVRKQIQEADVIVDAVFGNGLKNRPLYPKIKSLFEQVNRAKATVYAVDVPSGLRGSNGLTVGSAICADRTLVIQNPKVGLLLEDGPDFLGQATAVDVGISEAYTDSQKWLLDAASVPKLTGRKKNSNKYDYGTLSVIAGSQGMIGAGLMCSSACLRAGAGMVSTWVPDSIYNIVAAQMPWEIMVKPYGPGELVSQLEDYRASAYVFGPGVGRKTDEKALLRWLVQSEKPVVIDADGLYHLAQDKAVLKGHRGAVILTPHAGEFCRLCQIDKAAYQENSMDLGAAFAAEYQVVLVLKGYRTRIFIPHGADPSQCEIWFNTTGNPGMATAGSGDVLTGIIAGLLSQTESAADAVKLGVYLHGLAGDLAAKQNGLCALNAGDLIRMLPQALQHYYTKECS